jgi:hypothetical protein
MENPLPRFLSRSYAGLKTIVSVAAKPLMKVVYVAPVALCIAAVFLASATGAQVVNSVWLGSVDSDWNNSLNWSGTTVPFSNNNVIVQAAAPFSPVLRSGITINNLELQAGKTLDLTSTSITINGVVSGIGTFSVSPASSITIGGTAGGSAGVIRFSSSANTIGTFTVNRTGTAGAVTLGSPVTVSDAFTVVAGTCNTGDQLTLSSDVNSSARVGASAGTIAGKIIVEKYVPARRAWRLLCSSVSAVEAPSINTAWQEGAVLSSDNFAAGFGTHITGGPTSKGFDQSPTNSSSIKYMYSNTWNDLANTNATLVTRYPGYFFFLRGNRSYDIASTLSTMAPLPTVLRTKGNVNQGNLPAVSIAASGLTLVANPYASPVAFSAVAASGANLKNRLYLWDPALGGTAGVGGYVVLDWNGEGYTAVPASAMTSIVPAGQAFFVESANGTSTGKVFFNEGQKVSLSTQAAGKTTGSQSALAINLMIFNDDRTTAVTDGVLALYKSDYSGDVDKNDASKLNNLSDNISISSKGIQLTIERRALPQETETLMLNIASLRKPEYQLEIVPANFGATGMIASLYDKYTNALTQLSSTDTTRYNFSVSSNALSQQAGRFSIVYRAAPITTSAPIAVLNNETSINLEWEIANAQNVHTCDVEKADASGAFKSIGTVAQVLPNATNVSVYNFTDWRAASGSNIYRVKIICKSGQVFYSETVKLTVKNSKPFFEPEVKVPAKTGYSNVTRVGKRVQGSAINTTHQPGIAVFPNPVQGRTVLLSLINLQSGLYRFEILNQAGQSVFQSSTNYSGAGKLTINLDRNIAAGVYKLLARRGPAVYETSLLVIQ